MLGELEKGQKATTVSRSSRPVFFMASSSSLFVDGFVFEWNVALKPRPSSFVENNPGRTSGGLINVDSSIGVVTGKQNHVRTRFTEGIARFHVRKPVVPGLSGDGSNVGCTIRMR